MYRYLPFHVKDFFPVKGKIYHRLLLRIVYLSILVAFLSSFEFNAQSITLSQHIVRYGKKTLVAASIPIYKTLDKLIIFSSMVIISAIMFLTIRTKTNPHLISKYFHNIWRKNKNEETNLIKEQLPTIEITQIQIKTSIAISTATYNTILKNISKFEKSGKFLRKDINLTWLSNHLNTNTKYLSEVIKTHKGKNFNGYINGLRIEYITQKLSEVPVYRGYKISYLAEECGYASPQVFAIAFKKETGLTPSCFIEQLKTPPENS